MVRSLFIGVGAAGALAASISAGLMMRNEGAHNGRVADIRAAPQTICVSSNVQLVEGMTRACLTSAQYESLRDHPVMGPGGSPVAVNLSGPIDGEQATAQTCAEYDARTQDGWYALTSADQRREEYFKRTCGALSLLVDARPAETSHFAGGKADRADIESMAKSEATGFGEAQPSSDIDVAMIDDGVWKATIGGGETMIYEIAHADFTGDGVGEILSYVSVGAAGGTARTGAIGFLEKSADAAPCVFRAQ